MNRMTKTLLAILCVHMAHALELELDWPSVFIGAGYESISVLDTPAIDLVAGGSMFVPSLDPQMTVDAMVSYSVVKATKKATSSLAEYSTGIMNIGAYAGYLIEFDSPFLIRPKVGANLAYASITQKYALSLGYGATLYYDSLQHSNVLYFDVTKAGKMTLLSVGVSIPLY